MPGDLTMIFLPVADRVRTEVEALHLGPAAATRILTALIGELQAAGWSHDGQQAAVFHCANSGYVVHAFMNCDVFDEGC